MKETVNIQVILDYLVYIFIINAFHLIKCRFVLHLENTFQAYQISLTVLMLQVVSMRS